jgi:hypothetical protein
MLEWEKIAREILGINPNEKLPEKLNDLLTRTGTLCIMAGGKLYSRQVIALAIALCNEN